MSEWYGCMCYAEVDRVHGGGIHICILELSHWGECQCGTCGTYFQPTGVLPRPPREGDDDNA